MTQRAGPPPPPDRLLSPGLGGLLAVAISAGLWLALLRAVRARPKR